MGQLPTIACRCLVSPGGENRVLHECMTKVTTNAFMQRLLYDQTLAHYVESDSNSGRFSQ